MNKFLKVALIAITVGSSSASLSQAAELVMVDARACTYCAKFHSEVAPTYDSSAAGKTAPLRSVSVFKKWPADLAPITPAHYTPVFILVEKGHEVGRFAGYTDASAFWAKLNPLLARL